MHDLTEACDIDLATNGGKGKQAPTSTSIRYDKHGGVDDGKVDFGGSRIYRGPSGTIGGEIDCISRHATRRAR
jgi:hypothetical protein